MFFLKKKLEANIFFRDLEHVILNSVVNKIPCWHLRKPIYQLFGLKIGHDSRIGMNTVIMCPQKIRIGDRTIINEYCCLDGNGGITINNDVSISIYTKLFSATHDIESDFFEYKTNGIKIEDNVWIAANSLILDGTLIEEFAVISAGSIIKGYVEKNSVNRQEKARVKKYRKLTEKYDIDFSPFFR